MPEARAARGPRALAALLGLLLTALAGIRCLAALAGWLAQAAFARALRRTSAHAGVDVQDLVGLLALWGGALVAAAALVAWPLAALRDSGGLGATLALSLAVGVLLVGVWRLWPLFHAQERDGGGLAAHWRVLALQDTAAWRG